MKESFRFAPIVMDRPAFPVTIDTEGVGRIVFDGAAALSGTAIRPRQYGF